MTYIEIKKGKTYYGRRVNSIYPAGSDLAGPGLDEALQYDDEVSYQDLNEGVRSWCSARAFAAWCTGKER